MRFGVATQREWNFPSRVVGDFKFDSDRDENRALLFLQRNVMRVLAHHAKRHARSKTESNASATNSAATFNNSATLLSAAHTQSNHSVINGDIIVMNPDQTPVVARNESREAVMLDYETPKHATPHLAGESKRSSVRKLLEGAHRQPGAELVLELKNIRKKLNFNTNQQRDGEPDRKRVKRDFVRCQCHVAIWDNREPFRLRDPIVTRSQLCSVLLQGSPEECQTVDVEMDDTFRIKATEMHVPVKIKGGIQMTWGDKYFLEIKIIPCEEVNIWPPFKVLSKIEGTVSGALGKKSAATVQGALVTSYASLPQAPAANVPLSISFVQNGLTMRTKFGLELLSMWTVSANDDSEIKMEGSDWLEKVPIWTPTAQQNSPQETSAPSTEGTLSITRPKKVVVSYRLDVVGSTGRSREFRDASLDGYSCVGCRRREYQSLTELLFHLSTYHPKYKYTVEDEDENSTSGEHRHIAIKIDVADQEKKKPLKNAFKNPDTEIEWVAPTRPFDVGAYISGDQTWTGHGHKKPAKSQRPALNGASTSAAVTTKRKVGFTAAEEVQEIPAPERKQFKVIPSRARNQTLFFRSVSHRPMRLSESPLSETDNEIDDSWIRDKHHERIYEQEDLSDVQKEFVARWDSHIIAENLPQGRYISDSLVRFVRKEKLWLRQSHIWSELLNLIKEMMDHDVVESKVVSGCFRILWNDDNKNAATAAMRNLDEKGTITGTATATFGNGDRGPGRPGEFGEGSKSQANRNMDDFRDRSLDQGYSSTFDNARGHQSLHSPGSCGICLKPNVCKREAIVCGGAHCATPDSIYHLTCAGQQKRADDWLCRACFSRELERKSMAAPRE